MVAADVLRWLLLVAGTILPLQSWRDITLSSGEKGRIAHADQSPILHSSHGLNYHHSTLVMLLLIPVDEDDHVRLQVTSRRADFWSMDRIKETWSVLTLIFSFPNVSSNCWILIHLIMIQVIVMLKLWCFCWSWWLRCDDVILSSSCRKEMRIDGMSSRFWMWNL